MYKYFYLWLKQIDPTTIIGSNSINIEVELLFNYLSGMLIMSVVALSSLFSLIYIIASSYIIKNYDVEKKLANYPRIINLIYFTKKFNTFWIIIDLSILIASLSVMIFTSYVILGSIFNL
jgi:hypothetical protein